MYKKTAKSAHFLPRKGSYSTHPHRNGRVDVLPPSAVEPLYDCAAQIADATRQLDQLAMKRDTISQSAHGTARLLALSHKLCTHAPRQSTATYDFDRELRQVDEQMAALRRHIGSLKHLLAGGSVKTFEEAFHRVALAELSAYVYEELTAKARVILDATRASGGKQR